MKFSSNSGQKKAFNKVIKAIESAKKKGLHFYGKQFNLVAYSSKANDYIVSKDCMSKLNTGFATIECLSGNVLCDSGGDDYPSYRSQKDEDIYSDK